jgi:CBS domain-containing protein
MCQSSSDASRINACWCDDWKIAEPEERELAMLVSGRSRIASNEVAMKVHDAMTPDVQLCAPDDTLKDAAEAMAALGVGLLPVTDNERLVGMISDRDIAIRGVAMGRGPDSRVGDVMTADVKYCFEDQDLEEVTANMGEIQVRRLPVLSRDKRLVGIIALGDIAQVQADDGTGQALGQISRPGGLHVQE